MNNRSVFFYKKISVLPLSKNKERFSAKTKKPHKTAIFLDILFTEEKEKALHFSHIPKEPHRNYEKKYKLYSVFRSTKSCAIL